VVQPGDYLELLGGGGVHLIVDVPTKDKLMLNIAAGFDEASFRATANYRILRQPRVLLGEKPLEVPGDTVIDLGPPARTDPATGEPLSFLSASPTRSVNVPERLVAGAIGPKKLFLEVVFAPNGAVLSQHTGKVILWLRDGTARAPDLGSPNLLVIPVSTGFVAPYEVAPGSNPYLYTESGRGAGI
jgi:hypothetical protein